MLIEKKQGFSPAPARNCMNCKNREHSEWCGLVAAELKDLSLGRTCNFYQAHQYIFYQGNPCQGLYCLESGMVGIRKMDAQGNSVLVRLVNAGQTLGYRTFFSGLPYQASAEALEDSRICFIERATVHRLLQRNPELALRFLNRMAGDLQHAEASYLQTAYLPVRARLARLLLSLKEHYATMAADGTWHMRLPVLKQDLATMLGARPETLSRAIRELADDDVASFRASTVTISDLDALLDEVERT